MAPESYSIDDLENKAGSGVISGDGDTPGEGVITEAELVPAEPVQANPVKAEPPQAEAPGSPASGTAEARPASEILLAEIALRTRELADGADRYHARAEQREGVIDHLRSEVETLRRGERRGLLRPILSELARLRDDLLKQSGTLPADFGPDKAADLLRSYAETIELTLETNGVVIFAPDGGDAFNPRMHRRVSGEPTADAALAGHIASIRRDGYLDIEANSPIAPAEVTVFAVVKGEQQ